MPDPITVVTSSSLFWGVFLGAFFGCLSSLVGIWATNCLAEKKAEKEKRIEILENLPQTATLFFELMGLMHSADHLGSYYFAYAVIGDPKHQNHYKEESQRWTEEIARTNREFIK